MTMSISITADQIADAIWRGELSLPDIVRHLARERTADEDEGSLLVEFSDIGRSLATAAWAPGFHNFGVALDALAATHHEQLIKGDQS